MKCRRCKNEMEHPRVAVTLDYWYGDSDEWFHLCEECERKFWLFMEGAA